MPLIHVLIGTSLVYIGGMYLNDAFDAEFDRLMKLPKRSFHEFPSYWKIQHGPAFRLALRCWQFFKYDLRGRRPAA